MEGYGRLWKAGKMSKAVKGYGRLAERLAGRLWKTGWKAVEDWLEGCGRLAGRLWKTGWKAVEGWLVGYGRLAGNSEYVAASNKSSVTITRN